MCLKHRSCDMVKWEFWVGAYSNSFGGKHMIVFVCRIHVMAGRVPAGTKLSEVGVEMETTFVQNLKHAAEILAKVQQPHTLPLFFYKGLVYY